MQRGSDEEIEYLSRPSGAGTMVDAEVAARCALDLRDCQAERDENATEVMRLQGVVSDLRAELSAIQKDYAEAVVRLAAAVKERDAWRAYDDAMHSSPTMWYGTLMEARRLRAAAEGR